MLVYEEECVPRPAVIVFHETRRNKEMAVSEHDEHLGKGAFVRVYPDEPLHGERPRLGDAKTEAALWGSYLRGEGDALHDIMIPLVWGMAQEVSTIIDYLSTRQDLIIPRWGTYGFSVAGLISLQAAGLETRLDAAVAISPPTRFRFMALGMRFQWDNATLAEAITYDPLVRADRFSPTALLLTHGTRDEIVPIEATHSLFTRLLPHYQQNPERLRFSEYSHFRHSLDKPAPYTTSEAAQQILLIRQEARLWLEHFLNAS